VKRFIESEDRTQVTLLPDCLDDYIADDKPGAVDAFVEELGLKALGFAADPAGDRRAGLSPGGAAQALHLRLPERRAVEPPARARGAPLRRADVAAGGFVNILSHVEYRYRSGRQGRRSAD
jgi:hypothetical protein